MTKTQRLMEVMKLVYEKQRFTVEELADEFHVSYRTMLRYLHELSGMGVPLYSEVGMHGGYRILQTKSKLIEPSHASPFQLVVKPTTYIIGVELKAPFTAVYMAKAIVPNLWKELDKSISQLNTVIHKDKRIGVSLSKREIYHYIAGVEVSNVKKIPENMVAISLPTSQYALYKHLGESSRFETDQTYFYLLEKIRKAGMDHNPNAYALEIFEQGNKNEVNIYIPLK